MRTLVMSEIAANAPWLECSPREGETRKTVIGSFPFTIGRGHSADLHVDSSKVSREHATITQHGKKFKVTDLGSTNGTFVNGEQVEESTLGDGDILGIADLEFTFYCGVPEASRDKATQMISSSVSSSPSQEGVRDVVASMRRTQELVTHRAVRTLLQPILDLASNQAMGYEALAASGTDAPSPRCDTLAAPLECRGNDRLRQLFRRLACAEAARLPQGGKLFLGVTAAESNADWLLAHLFDLRERIDVRWQMVIEFPDGAVRTTVEFRSLLSSLRASQIQVAYDGYASGKAQIAERKDVAPDYLKLAPSLVRSIGRGKDRQRQVQHIVRASHDINCAVIATGIDQESDLAVCRELGITLAQGDFFSPVVTVEQLLQSAQNKPRQTANGK